MKKKQTAVQWLANEILKLEGIQDVAIPDNLFHIASQMEREQIEEAWDDGDVNFLVYDDGKDYYNQTFNQ